MSNIKLKDLIIEANSKKTYYHVSPINYNVDDVIQPYFDSANYNIDDNSDDNIDSIKKTIETILNKTKPSNLSSRDASIFLFKTLTDAKRYAKNMGNRYVYMVSSSDSVYWHDMNWIDFIFGKAVAWSRTSIPAYEMKRLKSYAIMYWNGESAKNPTLGNFANPIWEGMTKGLVKVIEKVK